MTASSTRRLTTRISLPRDMVDDVDRLVGQGNRASFIEEAVIGRLHQERLKTAISEMAGALADVDIPGWETPESTSRWVRAMRGDWDEPDEDTAPQPDSAA